VRKIKLGEFGRFFGLFFFGHGDIIADNDILANIL